MLEILFLLSTAEFQSRKINPNLPDSNIDFCTTSRFFWETKLFGGNKDHSSCCKLHFIVFWFKNKLLPQTFIEQFW